MSAFDPKRTRVCPLLLPTCYTRHSPWGHRDAAARIHWLARRRRRLAFCIGRTKRRTGRRTMRAIGLVLLSIAIMALLLTDADAKRRSSAQGSQWRAPAEAGARAMAARASATTAVMPRNNSVWPRCGGSAAFADLIRFQGRRMEPATPGRQVGHARLSPMARLETGRQPKLRPRAGGGSETNVRFRR